MERVIDCIIATAYLSVFIAASAAVIQIYLKHTKNGRAFLALLEDERKENANVNWKDFSEAYKYATRKWPDCRALNLESGIVITETQTQYTKKYYADWHRLTSHSAEVTSKYYLDFCNTLPAFRESGANVRVTVAPTRYGRLPVRISIARPDIGTRVVRTYKFQ